MKNALFSFFAIAILATSFISCEQDQSSFDQQLELRNTNELDENLKIGLTRSGCFGDCVTYDFSINNLGKVSFDAPKIGHREGTLPTKKLNNLIELLEAADLGDLENNYDSPLLDLPSMTISYKNAGFEKSIKCTAVNMPEKLEGIMYELVSIVDNFGWMNEHTNDALGETHDLVDMPEKTADEMMNPEIIISSCYNGGFSCLINAVDFKNYAYLWYSSDDRHQGHYEHTTCIDVEWVNLRITRLGDGKRVTLHIPLGETNTTVIK